MLPRAPRSLAWGVLANWRGPPRPARGRPPRLQGRARHRSAPPCATITSRLSCLLPASSASTWLVVIWTESEPSRLRLLRNLRPSSTLDDVGSPIQLDLENAINCFGPEVDDDGIPEQRPPPSATYHFAGRLRQLPRPGGRSTLTRRSCVSAPPAMRSFFAVDRRGITRFRALSNGAEH
jgi:hypothetical protein